MVTLVETFQHSRNGYPYYSNQSISPFWKWLPWLLFIYLFNIIELVTMVTLRQFNILELVTMVSLIKAFQHSRTRYHSYSGDIISTF